jgi:hypothetical protein
LFGFAPVEGRAVVAAFDGGRMTSEAGAMLLGATDRQLRLIERLAGCFTDCRAAELVEHTVSSLVGQRVFGIALGYEDLMPRPGYGGARRQTGGQAGRLCAAGRQIDAQSAGIEPRGADPLSQGEL